MNTREELNKEINNKPPHINKYIMTPLHARPKAYSQFSDIHGNEYSFPSYESFAHWWYSIPRRRMALALEALTFQKLERAATQSKGARATTGLDFF